MSGCLLWPPGATHRTSLTLSAPPSHLTRLSDRADPVPDEIWNEAARHFDETALAGLVISIK